MTDDLPGMDYMPMIYKGERVEVPLDNARELIRHRFVDFRIARVTHCPPTITDTDFVKPIKESRQ
jgi:hypothetical protein